jgi:5'/3'-nucleotidase
MLELLLTNDDGIDAPGIQALHQAAAGLGHLLVVAPDTARSGAGHSVTTREPILVQKVREGWHALAGTPADCTRVALTQLATRADWVLAGINRGGNLGADTYISGTVAAAREAAFLGRPAMALSQYIRADLELDWEWTVRQAAIVIRRLMDLPLSPRSFWNVNLPHLPEGSADPELVFCGLDLCPLDVRFRMERDGRRENVLVAHFEGNYHGRQRDVGRDVEVCFGGRIAVTEIPLDIAP